jgi:phosphatidylglycerophosphatase A
MAFVPFNLVWIAAGFLLFRLLDILKPWPIRWLDRHVKGGFGIMLDDAVAAVPVCILLNLGAHLFRV